MNRLVTRVWFCLPFVIVAVIDAALTLHGQDDQYWDGAYAEANEIFAFFAQALMQGPGAFLRLFAAWIAAFCIVILVLPAFLAEALAFALVMGHAWGCMTWLLYDLEVRYEISLLFFAAVALFHVFSMRMARRRINGPVDQP